MTSKKSSKKSKMQLPKTVYVKIVEERDGTEYLVAGNSPEELVLEVGDKLKIGVYEKIRIIDAEVVIKTEDS